MPASRSRCWPGCIPGCFELFANERIRSIDGPQGQEGRRAGPRAPARTCSWPSWRPMSGSIPVNDINWVTSPSVKPMELFAEGKIDAFLGFPPEPQELRARKIGHVIVNSAVDRPWSQYFCCLLAGSRDFVRKHPIATKRVMRAILKATDLCVAEPERVAQRLVDGGFTAALRLRAPDADRGPVRTLARVRPRGHAAVLRAAPARGGHDHSRARTRSSPRAPTGAS